MLHGCGIGVFTKKKKDLEIFNNLFEHFMSRLFSKLYHLLNLSNKTADISSFHLSAGCFLFEFEEPVFMVGAEQFLTPVRMNMIFTPLSNIFKLARQV